MSFKPPNLSAVLKLDAATCGVMALLLLAGAVPIGSACGLPVALLQGAGAVLIPCTLLFGVAGHHERARRFLLPVLMVANVLWVIASLALLGSETIDPDPLGTALVLVQAGAVALLTSLEFTGWRRTRRAQASSASRGDHA